MGKVGSTALHLALKKHVKHVYQVHSLHPEKIKKTKRILTEKGLGIPAHVRHSEYLIREVINPQVPCKIITPIRNPLQRNISAFFQEIPTQLIVNDAFRTQLGIANSIKWATKLPLPNEWKNELIYRLALPKLRQHKSQLADHFIEHYRHDIPLRWFEDEFEPALGIDALKSNEKEDVDFLEFQEQGKHVLVFKSELPDASKTTLIQQFLDMPTLRIEQKHNSTSKIYGSLYKTLKDNIALPTELMHRYQSSAFSRRFYPEENIA